MKRRIRTMMCCMIAATTMALPAPCRQFFSPQADTCPPPVRNADGDYVWNCSVAIDWNFNDWLDDAVDDLGG